MTKTIPLSDEFKSNTTKATLKAPSWRFSDSVFDMHVGKYHSSNTDISWVDSSEVFVSKRSEWRGFINWLLFDETGVIIREFDVDKSQRFSFDMYDGEHLVSRANCGIFSQSLREQNTSFERADISTDRFDTRKRSFLSCVLEHKDKKWELTLDSEVDKPLTATLRTSNEGLTLKEISEAIYLNESGEKLSSAPSWKAQRSGLSFYHEDEQISAISFGHEATFWVKNDLATPIEELMVTANYALTVYNWIDDEWR